LTIAVRVTAIFCGGIMKRKSLGVLLCASTMLDLGCGMAKAPRGVASDRAAMAMMMPLSVRAASSQRYIAERHKLVIITPESELQKSWEATVAFCGTIQCEVVSSSITTRTGDSAPSGAIALRVLPDGLKKLLGRVEKVGKVAQHTTEREDKTTAV